MPTDREALRAAEKELVDRCVQGDQQAWRDFYRNYGGILRYLIVRRPRIYGLLAPPDLVDDLTQDVFYSLFVHDCHQLRKFDPTRAGLLKFLGLRVRDPLREHLRSKGRQRRAAEARLPLDLVDPRAGAEREGLLLEELQSRLTADERAFLEAELLGQATDDTPRYSAATRWRRPRAVLAKWKVVAG